MTMIMIMMMIIIIIIDFSEEFFGQNPHCGAPKHGQMRLSPGIPLIYIKNE